MDKIAFLFPGQGSQYVGMLKKFYEQYSIVKDTFDEANEILKFDLSKLCFEGSLGKLSKVENSLLAILVSSVAEFRLYMQKIGIRPQFCIGHSLGEYSALTCSGAIKFSDAIELVKKRVEISTVFNKEVNGSMTIVEGLNPKIVEEECFYMNKHGKGVSVCCYNSNNQVNIAGKLEELEELENKLIAKGATVTPLLFSLPFHSSLLEKAANEFKKELLRCKFNDFIYPVISNVTGMPYEGKESIVENLVNQMKKPVRWIDIINYLERVGVTKTIELGPKNILSKLIDDDLKNIKTYSFDHQRDREKLKELENKNMNINLKQSIVDKCLAIAVSAPNRNLRVNNYKEEVIDNYKKIKKLKESSSYETIEQGIEAINLLKSILNAKNTSLDEKEEWFNMIINDSGYNYELSKIHFKE
ncbi:MAG: ACP S-malonyltransferase [Clostridium sp.]|nr:ACP S-malonyltransferase [Clostridium sp.]